MARRGDDRPNRQRLEPGELQRGDDRPNRQMLERPASRSGRQLLIVGRLTADSTRDATQASERSSARPPCRSRATAKPIGPLVIPEQHARSSARPIGPLVIPGAQPGLGPARSLPLGDAATPFRKRKPGPSVPRLLWADRVDQRLQRTPIGKIGLRRKPLRSASSPLVTATRHRSSLVTATPHRSSLATATRGVPKWAKRTKGRPRRVARTVRSVAGRWRRFAPIGGRSSWRCRGGGS